ncbi:serine/threonine-protein kinase [Symbioplanes lichenis]|uniref:serine/threonine-protein kinase n=1 Tax=Symbioplanes lichenis TaxID=1629072 RepID=UPI00273A19FA|nr:serine/threonine-protein kinase [Actinoplanes lichenis]
MREAAWRGFLSRNNQHMGWLATGRRGSLIGGRYRLVERLGTGGMSEVWRGHDEVLGREVAVKLLAPRHADDFRFRARLRQEAVAAARLCHPHVTGVFDFGAFPYVVMELNDGEAVADRLRRDGPLPWRTAVTVAAEVASALAMAHARGIVHRDVTPANVMLTGSGAKIVDFGISAVSGQRDAAPDGSLLGTPAYLAPERLSGGPVAPPADVYALGLLLYRMLTGGFPWPADSTTEALRAHLYADPAPLPPLPGLPPEVADLCLRCLAKQPENRPGAEEVATELARLVGLQPVIPAAAEPARPAVRVAVRPRQRPALWLRASLRLGQSLRLGVPRPLGGGLFAVTGRRGSLSRLSDLILSGRHRLHAAAATVALVAALGLVWTSTREPVDVATAQAAAAGAAPVPHGTGCKVRYRVQRDSGTDFGAQLTVINTGEHTLSEWRLVFSFSGGQRLTDAPKRLSQQGRKLVLRAKKGVALRPGRSASVSLSASYRATNPLPLTFSLNGHECQAEILGAVAAPEVSEPSRDRPSRSVRAPQRKESPRPPAPSLPTNKPSPEVTTPSSGSPVPRSQGDGFSTSI